MKFALRLFCTLLALQFAGSFPVVAQDAREVAPDVRQFDQEKLEAYYSNEQYGYGKKFRRLEQQQLAKDAFWARIRRFLTKDRVGEASLLEILLAIVVVATVFFVVLSFLGVDVRRLFKKRGQDIVLPDEELAEDLKELDFDQLLAQAQQQNDFRRGVRLLYLETLKMLADRNLIRYAKHKTNYEYLLSLRSSPLYDDFERLTLQYDYVWYGDFAIDQEGFGRMRQTFRHFQGTINTIPRQAITQP